MQGKTISGYTLKRPLGKGGMAEVWYAENSIEKPAAVKILREDLAHNPDIVERFRNEAKVMVKLLHANIRQVYDYGDIDGRPAIVMEYLEGDDLKAHMKRGERFSAQQLEKWWNQMIDALNYTHGEGVVHRDIKPSNIFLDRKGNVHLLDFGIAKIKEAASGTKTGSTMGTLIYMSPEQIKDPKRVDYRSDVYSLAVTFVHLLSGKAPYDSTNSSDYMIQNAIVEKPLDLTALPTSWRSFLEPYLAKGREQRPALAHFGGQAEDYGETDETEIDGPQPAPRPKPSPTPKEPDVVNPKRTWLWVALAAIALAGVVIGWATRPEKEDGYEPSVEIVEDSPAEEHVDSSFSSTPLTFTANGVSFTMIPVEGGTFTMGATAEQGGDAYDDEKPAHSVTLSSYYMGETEVTQALWQAVMGSNPSHFSGSNLPVEQVSWNDCHEFITKLSQLCASQLNGRQFRLPTEAEWEYAARGGKQSKGYKYSGSNTLDNVAWYTSTTNVCGTKPVGTKQANELGLYDMSGNVWEWCSDLYGSYSSSAQTDPTGPTPLQALAACAVVAAGTTMRGSAVCRAATAAAAASRTTTLACACRSVSLRSKGWIFLLEVKHTMPFIPILHNEERNE